MSERDFGKMYLNEWKPISAELYDFAARCCRTYDTRCDVEQRNYTKISKEEIDVHYGQAVKMGWDQDAKAWRRFCYDARAASPSTAKESG